MRTGASMRIVFLVSVLVSVAAVIAGCGGKDQPEGHGIQWTGDVSAAISKAAAEEGLVMVDFTAVWCPPCRAMEGLHLL